MDTDIRKEWTRRLRDPKRVQGTGQLRKRIPHKKVEQCCLDILCEMAVEAGVIKQIRVDVGTHINYGYNVSGLATRSSERNILPPEVQTWAKFFTGNGSFKIRNDIGGWLTETTLINLNDDGADNGDNCTFPQIADVIDYTFRQPGEPQD